jgi:hypothetical protein
VNILEVAQASRLLFPASRRKRFESPDIFLINGRTHARLYDEIRRDAEFNPRDAGATNEEGAPVFAGAP